MMRFFRKYHKWLGIIYALIILCYVFSGIILNHRKVFSSIDVNRKLLPAVYRYNNWNNAAVRSTLKLSADSILVYGNIGIWLTDSSFTRFTDFNSGFPKGIDNHKIFRIIRTSCNKLVAGALSGLYILEPEQNKWIAATLPVRDKNITDIIQIDDTVYLLTRSFLLKTGDLKKFSVSQLPPPEGYDNKVSLFKTLWVVHRGEIYGLAGKLVVDFAGLVFAFLTITGFIVFVNKIILKKETNPADLKARLKRSNRWNIKWHNKLGWITIILLILNTLTGMFLRPPLLALIAYSKVNKIPFTELADVNPWFDQLRRITYDRERDRFVVATSEGFYYSDDNFHTDLKKFIHQPPASIMGVNVLEKTGTDTYLVGSFEGLFEWNSGDGEIFDYIKKQKYIPPSERGRPIGDYLISGFTSDYKDRELYFDYTSGAGMISGPESFPQLPRNVIDKTPMSLWNVALEIHTGRIYQPVIGDFYVLIVPLTGLIVLFILISGFIVWLRIRKNS